MGGNFTTLKYYVKIKFYPTFGNFKLIEPVISSGKEINIIGIL